jgi:hypothetical protein
MYPAGTQPHDDIELQRAFSLFDEYCQKLILAFDAPFDVSKRAFSIEYCAFLHGAALAIVRGYEREDREAAIVWLPYFSQFMELKLSVRYALGCESQMAKSRRLQGVEAAGGNTAQAVLAAWTRGRAEELNDPDNAALLPKIFSELCKLMVDERASDEELFSASTALYDSVHR